MAKTTLQLQLPWEDRWNQPEPDILLEPLTDPQAKPFGEIMKRLSELDGIEMEMSWQGISWKWSYVYRCPGAADKHSGLEQFAYMVPRPGSVIVCIPLTSEFIQALPFRRLNRYIRDGIRVAKCAVDIHWATWTPMAMTEVEHLYDLIKRKHRFINGDDRRKKKSTPAKAKKSDQAATEQPEKKTIKKKKTVSKKVTKKVTKKKTTKTTKATKAVAPKKKTTKKTSSSRSKKKK